MIAIDISTSDDNKFLNSNSQMCTYNQNKRKTI